jgi:hypothetical protein
MKTKELICDFCFSDEVVCGFDGPATAVVMAGEGKTATWQQSGGWAACEPCAKLMEAGKLEELANRAIDAPGNGMNPRNESDRILLVALLLTQYNKISRKREAA